MIFTSRGGANDGFQEAIGELMSMCVSTPKHLRQIGLIEEEDDDEEIEINYLFSKALTTIASMPFHYLNDLWRWKIFKKDSTIPERKWNQEFWKLSKKITGVEAPVPRNDSVLDGPTIYHVSHDYDMIRYFTRTVLQFQFAKALCDEAGHQGQLNQCDFYGSLAAGKKLESMLKLGSSLPWEDALQVLTGGREMNSQEILKYFAKLQKWLQDTNEKEGNIPGWD
ncbi:unnamed protein product [Allacma fusca]|uniref:Angiotensin-converting enzyme n=1 Tax=Allacma fusca TaxID=39272 RepID=A0A8J2LBK2_9HEXA|nr:unnamed protein product [Allacma fusca]